MACFHCPDWGLNIFQSCVNLAPLRFLLKVTVLSQLLATCREIYKDFLPTVTRNDQGPFTDRMVLPTYAVHRNACSAQRSCQGTRVFERWSRTRLCVDQTPLSLCAAWESDRDEQLCASTAGLISLGPLSPPHGCQYESLSHVLISGTSQRLSLFHPFQI